MEMGSLDWMKILPARLCAEHTPLQDHAAHKGDFKSARELAGRAAKGADQRRPCKGQQHDSAAAIGPRGTSTSRIVAGLLSTSHLQSLRNSVFIIRPMSGIMVSAPTSKLHQCSQQNVETFVRIQNFTSCSQKKHDGDQSSLAARW